MNKKSLYYIKQYANLEVLTVKKTNDYVTYSIFPQKWAEKYKKSLQTDVSHLERHLFFYCPKSFVCVTF